MIPVGTTLVYKAGLFPGKDPQIVMLVPDGTQAQLTQTPIPITITAVLPPTLPFGNLTPGRPGVGGRRA